MKQITLTKEQVSEILEAFSYNRSNHVPCPQGCCWDSEPMSSYIPDFLEEKEYMFTIPVEDTQIKEESEL